MNKNPLLSWQFAFLKIMLFALLGLMLEKPEGAIAGSIALAQKGFGLATYNIAENKVYALANGPRGSACEVERGVWINPDGTFQIDHLPVGEYSVKLRAPGYATNYIYSVFVQEGKVTHQEPMTMELLEPSVNIASNARVFTSKEQPTFWINASGATKATVEVYPKKFLDLLKAARKQAQDGSNESLTISTNLDMYKPSDTRMVDWFAKQQPVESLSTNLTMDSQDSSHASFKVSKPLAKGDYVALAKVENTDGKKDWNMLWFTVTDLGLIMKEAPEKTVVRAIDLNTLKPRAGVSVQLLDQQDFSVLGKGSTGADGFVTIVPSMRNRASSQSSDDNSSSNDDQSSSTNHDVLAMGTQLDDSAYGGMWFSSISASDKYQSYCYTERPIYRLGQTVYYKVITRTLTPGGLHNPGQMPVSIEVEDPDNNKLWHGKLTTNKFGACNGTFNIPDTGKTGAYQIAITYPGNQTSYTGFEVAEYRKPEYQVEVQPLAPRVVAGSKMKCRIRANYFFGAPVQNARVKYSVYSSPDWNSRYRLMPRPEYYEYFDSWGSDDDADYYSSAGDFVTEGYAQTDSNGEAIVEFDTQKDEPSKDSPYTNQYMDKRYKVDAEVTDMSMMSCVGSGYCCVTAGDFALFVDPASYVVKAGEPLRVNFTALDYSGKPVANDRVTVKMVRWIYDSSTYSYKGSEIAGTALATTDASGKGSVSLGTAAALPTDTYYISAESLDAGGHKVYDQNSIWVASSQWSYVLSENEAEKQPLTIKLDKAVYKAGDTIKAMICAPVHGSEGAEALVSIEATGLHELRAVPLKATAELVELPVKAQYAPNVYLTVTFVGRKHQFYNQSKVVKVSPQSHFLNLSIDTDKQKYKPGETVKYTIHAAYPDGKPAANADLSLGLVDESIYSIRAEVAQDIQKFFYKRRTNLVNTACSFPEEYSGGPDKMEPSVRKDFRDTAAWIPDLTTNDKGIAIASIKLPDNLTTWRATVRGIDSQTNVGTSVNKILCTQDLIVRLALPRFFSQGDEGTISAIVHNYTDKPQNVKLVLSATPEFKIDQPLTQQINVAPDKAEKYSWPVKLPAPGEGVITIKAIGQTASDALERKLPVRPLGVPAFAARAGLLTSDDASLTLPVGLSADAAAGTAKYVLGLAASSIGPVLGNFNALIDYPYGCTEQTMDRMMPSIVAMRLHQTLGLPIDGKTQKRFDKAYQQSISKLYDYQHGDGGWGWWQNDESNPYLTSLVLEGFDLLRNAGYSVDEQRRKNGYGWLAKAVPELSKQMRDPKHKPDTYADMESRIDLAKMLYSLALAGQKPDPALRQWLLQLSPLPPEALTYLTMAYQKSGDSQTAKVFYSQLLALANQTPGYTDWDHSPSMMKRLGVDRFGDYSYRFTGIETTALALRAVLSMEPKNTDRIESIKNWILLQHGKDGWGNTKTTGTVFLTLMEEELNSQGKSAPSFSLIADLADKVLSSLNFAQTNLYAPQTDIEVPITPISQNLVLQKHGPGRLYYNSLVTYFRNLKPGDQIDEKGIPSGLKVSRAFFRLQPPTMGSDGKMHFTTKPLEDNKVKAGETILMKLYVDSPIALPYVMVEAALPSGGEVVQDNSKLDNVEDSNSDSGTMSGDWGNWWWTHEDVLDDRLVFFCTSLPAGKSEFHTLLRMEMPGNFQMNPVDLEGMYTRAVRAYSNLGTLQVRQ